MKYKHRPPVKVNNHNRMDLIDIDMERFEMFCEAFGGKREISREIGKCSDYLTATLNKYYGKIPFPAYVTICDTYGLPDKFLMGYGEKRDLVRWIKLNAPEPESNNQRHAVCDDYCIGCMYLSKAPSPNLPVEKCCDFNFTENEPRGCPAGTGCKRKRSGKIQPPRPLLCR